MENQFIDPQSVENRYNMTSSNHLFPAPSHNGHVSNIKDEKTNAYAERAYRTVEDKGVLDTTIRYDMIGHLHTCTPLNQVFFSQDNLNKLQEDLQDQVLRMSGGKYRVGKQSDTELKLIMRSYYLTYAKNNPLQVAEELADLNARVVGYAATKVYSEVDFHQFYLDDLQNFAPPIANPMNSSVYGTRTGELKSFF